jgi:hypothetical protein
LPVQKEDIIIALKGCPSILGSGETTDAKTEKSLSEAATWG